MKFRPSILAAAFGAAAVFSAPAPAIQNAEDVSAGERFRRPNVSIDAEARLPGGGTLVKGPADVEVESLGHGNVKATFFQGGVRKGQADGIIVGGGNQAMNGVVVGPHHRTRLSKLSDLGLDANTPCRLVPGAGKIDFVIGNPGANQILIGLLLPAAQAPAIVVPKQGLVEPPEPDKKPRNADVQEK